MTEALTEIPDTGRTDMLLPSDYPTDAELYQHLDQEDKRKAAYIHYVGEEMPPADIAAKIVIPLATVRKWIIQGKWNARVREMRVQRQEEAQIALELFRGDNRLEEVKEQLAAGVKGRELVMQLLAAGDLTAGQLKQCADALAAFTGVAARAVGVGETVETKTSAQDDAKAGRIRPPAVVIVAGSGARVSVQEALTSG